jgi:hypothetical protein
MSRLPNDEHDSNSNDPVSRSDGFADYAPSEMPSEGPENYDGPPTSEEPQPSSEPVKRKKPRRDDPDRARRYLEIVQLLERTPRPPRPTSLDIACLDGICGRTQDFLMGDFARDATWQKRLWLAATDLNGSGYTIDEAIWGLVEGAGAVDAPEKREAALKTIANAYMKPRLSAREYMKNREADQGS